jgi:hypothetical protein
VFARSSARSEEIFRHSAEIGAARITVQVARRLGDPQRHRAVLKVKRQNEPPWSTSGVKSRRSRGQQVTFLPFRRHKQMCGDHLVTGMANAQDEFSGVLSPRRREVWDTTIDGCGGTQPALFARFSGSNSNYIPPSQAATPVRIR